MNTETTSQTKCKAHLWVTCDCSVPVTMERSQHLRDLDEGLSGRPLRQTLPGGSSWWLRWFLGWLRQAIRASMVFCLGLLPHSGGSGIREPPSTPVHCGGHQLVTLSATRRLCLCSEPGLQPLCRRGACHFKMFEANCCSTSVRAAVVLCKMISGREVLALAKIGQDWPRLAKIGPKCVNNR